VAIRGVLVQGDLRVERVHGAVGRQDQRVDLGEVAVTGRVAVIELHEEFCRLLACGNVQFRLVNPTSRGREVQAPHRVDREKRNGVGVLFGDNFDLDAALGAQHPQVRLVGAIQGE